LPRYSEVNWEKAACKGAPTNLFYAVEENRKIHEWIDIGILRSICGSCPIFKQCLAYALSNEHYGVWGGMTTHERNAFNGRAPEKQTREIILELAEYGISITDIQEAVREYSDYE
jgi:WhiB family transcriptional regulator, redox-sensing transcriptional regulator